MLNMVVNAGFHKACHIKLSVLLSKLELTEKNEFY